jgi:hypothetical protein
LRLPIDLTSKLNQPGMTNELSLHRPRSRANAAMVRHREAIEHIKVNHEYADDSQGLLRLKPGIMAAECNREQDVGESTRGHIDFQSAYILEK